MVRWLLLVIFKVVWHLSKLHLWCRWCKICIYIQFYQPITTSVTMLYGVIKHDGHTWDSPLLHYTHGWVCLAGWTQSFSDGTVPEPSILPHQSSCQRDPSSSSESLKTAPGPEEMKGHGFVCHTSYLTHHDTDSGPNLDTCSLGGVNTKVAPLF